MVKIINKAIRYSNCFRLGNKINSVWPFPNKDKKMEKIKGLRALLIKSTQMQAYIAIEQIEKEYPRIREGSISARTAELLDSIQHEQQCLKQLPVKIA